MTCLPAAKHPWFGIWPVMLTPMHPDRSVDDAALEALTEWYLDGGAAGLFACCQSSETFELNEQEKLAVTERVLARVAGRVPVIAGAIGQPDNAVRLRTARELADLGALCVVLATGEFAAAAESDDVLCDRLERFAESLPDVSLGLYECPRPYHRLISPAALKRLAHSGRFVWMKETSSDYELQRSKLEAVQGTPMCLFNACTPLLRRSLELGYVGYSGITCNISSAVCDALCRVDVKTEQVEAWMQLLSYGHSVVIPHGYPTTVKALLALRGLPIGETSRMSPGGLSRDVRKALVELHEAVRATEAELCADVASSGKKYGVLQ